MFAAVIAAIVNKPIAMFEIPATKKPTYNSAGDPETAEDATINTAIDTAARQLISSQPTFMAMMAAQDQYDSTPPAGVPNDPYSAWTSNTPDGTDHGKTQGATLLVPP